MLAILTRGFDNCSVFLIKDDKAEAFPYLLDPAIAAVNCSIGEDFLCYTKGYISGSQLAVVVWDQTDYCY